MQIVEGQSKIDKVNQIYRQKQFSYIEQVKLKKRATGVHVGIQSNKVVIALPKLEDGCMQKDPRTYMKQKRKKYEDNTIEKRQK